ncbi:hypothetical protein [Muricoccus radiodurans]|uniref:hypothetical protein n=1 Tax=Muricoccus radiodurans TaxID=2231721 RepID=UPI003CFAB768
MASRTIAIRLTLEQAAEVRAALQGIGETGKAALKSLEDATGRAASTQQSLGRAANDTGRAIGSAYDPATRGTKALGDATDVASERMSRFRTIAGSAGFQAQDLAVQLQMGTNALTAIGQQGSQFLGAFGPGGAVAGAVLVAGTLALQFAGIGDEAKKAAEKMERDFETATQVQRNLKTAIDAVSEAFMNQAERAARAAAAARTATGESLMGSLTALTGRNDDNAANLTTAQRDVDRLEALVARRERDRARMRRAGANVAEDDVAAAERGELFTARQRVQGLQQDMDRVNTRIQEATAAVNRLRQAGVTGPDQFGPDAPRGISASVDELRRELDRAGTIRAEYANRVTAINARQAQGEIDAAEATRLLGLAQSKQADDLRKLAESESRSGRAAARRAEAEASRNAATELREQSQAENDLSQLRMMGMTSAEKAQERYATMLTRVQSNLRVLGLSQEEFNRLAAESNPVHEEARRILEAIKTPAERYAEQLDTLRRALAANAIDQDRFNRAVAALDPATKAAEEAAKRQGEAITRANRQVTDSIVSYSADSFADLFDKNGKGWKGMLDTFESTAKRTFSRIAAEAIIRPIVTPIVNGLNLGGVFGSGLATAGGSGITLFGPGTASRNVPADAQPIMQDGSLVGYARQASSLYQTGSGLFGGGGAGVTRTIDGSRVFFSGTGGVDTSGFGSMAGTVDGYLGTGLQNWLNQPAYSAPFAATGGLTASQSAGLAAAGFDTGMAGSMGVSMGPVGTESLAAASGAGTYGAALGGGLAIAGGAYGLYQGLERGGVGGYTQAAGGAAMAGMGAYAALAGSMAAVPVYGWIAAAALMVIGSLLPGQKPSNMEGNYSYNTLTGVGAEGGQLGDKYSQENRDQSKAAVDALKQLATQIGGAAGLGGPVGASFKVGFGDRDGAYFQMGDQRKPFNADEEGVKKMVEDAATEFLRLASQQTSDENVRSIIGRRAAAGAEATVNDLQWYKETYKPVRDELEIKAATFATSLENIAKPWDEMIAKARDLGLAEDFLATKRQNALDKAVRDRDFQFLTIQENIAEQLNGLGLSSSMSMAEIVNARWSRTANANLESTLAQLEAMGLTAGQVSATMADLTRVVQAQGAAALEQVAAQEEANRQAQAMEGLSRERDALATIAEKQGTLVDFLNGMDASAPGVSPQNAFLAQQRAFAEAVEQARAVGLSGADLAGVTSAAANLLSAGDAYLGRGAEGSALQNMVRSMVSGLGASLDLPAFGGSLDRVSSNLIRLTDRMEDLEGQILNLKEELRTTRLTGTR